MTQKGMSMTMQLVITAIILVLTALTILVIMQDRIVGGPERVEGEGNLLLCQNDRDSYCNSNPQGCWNATAETEQDTSCTTIMDRENDTHLYNCAAGDWYSENDQNQILAGLDDTECGSTRD